MLSCSVRTVRLTEWLQLSTCGTLATLAVMPYRRALIITARQPVHLHLCDGLPVIRVITVGALETVACWANGGGIEWETACHSSLRPCFSSRRRSTSSLQPGPVCSEKIRVERFHIDSCRGRQLAYSDLTVHKANGLQLCQDCSENCQEIRNLPGTGSASKPRGRLSLVPLVLVQAAFNA